MKTILLLVFVLLSPGLFAGGITIGDKAPDFTLKNVDGKMVGLKDYGNEKGVIVVFTCNHCPYAKAYQDRLIELDKKYKKLGFPVVAINPNNASVVPEDSYENMVIRAKEKNFSFPYLRDENQEIVKLYGAEKTPHVYLLQKEGKNWLVKYIGAIDDNYKDPSAVKDKYLENAVNALLEGKNPEMNFTKAIGCSIKL